MRTFAHVIFFAVLLTGVFAASAKADTLYTYVADTFTNVTGIYAVGDRVTGSFVLSSSYVFPNQGAGIYQIANFVTSYSFTDGHQTLTQTNSTADIQVGFHTDGTSIVPTGSDASSNWYVAITTSSGEVLTEDLFGAGWQTVASLGNSEGHILSIDQTKWPGGPGTWSVQVPEGGTTALFLLAGLTLLTPFIGLKRVTRGL